MPDASPPGYVHELFELTAAAHPDRVAIESLARSLSYAQLRAAAGSVATQLCAVGVTPGQRIGILADDRATLAAGILAVLQRGCAFVVLDPELPSARLRSLLDTSDCACVLTEPGRTGLAALAGSRVVVLDPDTRLPASAAPAPVRWAQDGPCYLYFTSGSSGAPKPIVGRLSAIDHFIRWEASLLGAVSGAAPLRVSQLAPPSFDAFLRDLFLPLCTGGTMCVPDRAQVSDPAGLRAWLEASRVAVLHCVPSVFRVLLEAQLGPSSLPALRSVLLAGEALYPQDLRRWWAAVGDRIALVNLYGPSETTMVKLFHVLGPADLELQSIPIGRPMPGAELVLLADDGAPADSGSIGEICIRTDYAAYGYFRQPQLTARSFLPGALYRTGDYGRLRADGVLFYLGRRDRQIKLHGVRIELDEIELALRACAGVLEAAVELRDGPAPEAPAALLAWVRVASPTTPTSLRRELAGLLPASMLPSVITAVAAMPRTLTGKLDRRALPDPRRIDRRQTAPRNEVERSLASLWQTLLGATAIGCEDSFFELGGNSLLAAQMVARVRASFGVELSLARVLQTPSLAEVAAAIANLRGKHAAVERSVIPRQGPGPQPLSFAQISMWLLDRLVAPTGALNLYLGHQLRGPLDKRALEAAFAQLHARHGLLRARFGVEQGQLVQHIDDALAVPWTLVDLRGLDEHTRQAELERRTQALLRARLLASTETSEPAPAWTVTLLRLADDDARLILVMHHIICDGASLATICREVEALYAGRTLPALALEYVDYAAWVRACVSGPRLRAWLDHERHRIEAATSPQLPVDRPPSLIPDLSGAQASIELPAALLAALTQVATRESATLFMVLHAAFQLLLGALSGRARVLVASPVAGRARPELEQLVGVFMNIVVLGADASGDPSFRAFLRRVRADLLDAIEQQELPFELLTRSIPAGRDGRHPLLRVMFNLLNMGSFELSLPGTQIEGLALDNGSASFDLALNLEQRREGICVTARYARALFDASTIDAMLADYRALLHRVAADADANISALGLPPPKLAARSLAQPGLTLRGLWSDDPPPALAALWRATSFVLGGPDTLDDEDMVTLRWLGEFVGRQLGLIAPDTPSDTLDGAVTRELLVLAVNTLGPIARDPGQPVAPRVDELARRLAQVNAVYDLGD